MWADDLPTDSLCQHFKKFNKALPIPNVPENLVMVSWIFPDILKPYNTISVSFVPLSRIWLEMDHITNFKRFLKKRNNETSKISKWYLQMAHNLQPSRYWYNFLSTAHYALVTCARMSIYAVSFHFYNISIYGEKKRVLKPEV